MCWCLQVVATHLPPEEIEGIRQMFMDLDADGSGTISFEELREGEQRGRGGCACMGAPADGTPPMRVERRQ